MNQINSQEIKQIFQKSKDVLVRPIEIPNKVKTTIHLFCVDGLISSQILDMTILRPIFTDDNIKELDNEDSILKYLLGGAAYHAFASESKDYELMMTCVLSGMAALIFDELEKVIIFDVRGFEKRSISEPSDEGVMRGAKDSFIEALRTNTALVRRRIRSPYLVIEQLQVGKLSKTDIALVYISDVCDMEIVDKLREDLQKIDIDNISSPSFIEEYITENKRSIFPQTMYTQRPDRCCANVTDGRIALIIDGFPLIYILPCQLPMLLQSPEDYAQSYISGSAFRALRYITMLISLILPGFYIAVTTFHNQMLPVQMVLSIQESKINVPFATWIEVLGLLFSFEILIEAGLRLPKTIGTAMSIVGGLVVGQAAVSANIISPAVVIIVALTGIAGFTLPNQDLATAIRVCRFGLGICASLAGFFGLTIGITFLLLHLCSIDNHGVAYLAPFVDTKSIDVQDTLFRFPVRNFKFRPDGIAKKNHRKQK